MELHLVDKDREGMVLRIERSSIHDGSGFRTVVFLKGCPLRCQWCSTPESQSFMPETTAGGVTYGTRMTVGQVMREIRKDSLFYFISSGGLTLSGGEILVQPEFSLALLKNAKLECFHTAVETSFFAPWQKIQPMLPYIDTAYVDLKVFDPKRHKEYCGISNERILKNLELTNVVKKKFQLVVRTPLIPGVNDSEEELESIGRFCAGLRQLHYVELLPYHKLGMATYERLGRPYLLGDVPTPSQEHMEACRKIVRQYVQDVR